MVRNWKLFVSNNFQFHRLFPTSIYFSNTNNIDNGKFLHLGFSLGTP